MLIDIQNYYNCLSFLDDKEWNKLATTDKISVLRGIELEVSKRENRNPCLVFGQDFDSNSKVLGYYDPNNKCIILNNNYLNSNFNQSYKTALDTILHEGRHAYQDQVVNNLIEHDNLVEKNEWKYNNEHYYSPEKNYEKYWKQPIEVDARNFAKNYAIQIELDKAKTVSKDLSAKYIFENHTTISKQEELEEELKNEYGLSK